MILRPYNQKKHEQAKAANLDAIALRLNLRKREFLSRIFELNDEVDE